MSFRFSGLWRHPDFMRLWTGQTISKFGSAITREALPLTALLLLGATPLQMGVLAAIGSAPVLLASLLAGVWVDRLRRRPIMIVADLVRALLLLSIPVAALLGHLRLEHLFIVAPLVAVLTAFFDVAYQSFVPTLVSREHILEANGKLAVCGSLAEITAPGVAGVLVQVLTGPLTLVVDAVSFLISALLLVTIHAAEVSPRKGANYTDVRRETGEGFAFVAGSPLLRAFAAHSLTAGFFGNFFAGLYALYCIRDLGMSPALLGISVAAGGCGALVGALVAERSTRYFGMGSTIVAALGIGAAAGALIPLASGSILAATAMIMVSQLIGDAARSVSEVNALSVRQAVTPDALLGRVNSSLYLIDFGIGPCGALAGGALAGMIGVRETVAIAVLGSALSVLWIVRSPVRVLDSLPNREASEHLRIGGCMAAIHREDLTADE